MVQYSLTLIGVLFYIGVFDMQEANVEYEKPFALCSQLGRRIKTIYSKLSPDQERESPNIRMQNMPRALCKQVAGSQELPSYRENQGREIDICFSNSYQSSHIKIVRW